MQYKYRWYYAASLGLVLIFLAYCWDFSPLYNEASQLQTTENQLIQDLSTITKEIHSEPRKINHSYFLQKIENAQAKQLKKLFQLSKESGLVLQKMQIITGDALARPPMDIIQIKAEGNFVQLSAFLFSLAAQLPNIVLTNFSYAAASLGLAVIHMQMMIVPINFKISGFNNKKIWPHYNPFCFAASELQIQEDKNDLLQVPLNEINMVGYIKQGMQTIAIVSLSNGLVSDVMVGAKLGLEQGEVQAIAKDHITINSKEDKKFIIRMPV